MEQATIYLTEEELARVMFFLPNDDGLREHLQFAGNNIFNWGGQ